MVPLPRTPSVNHLLQQYHSDMRTERKGMSEVVHGIQAYFDKALPNILLYKEERAQVRNCIQLFAEYSLKYETLVEKSPEVRCLSL